MNDVASLISAIRCRSLTDVKDFLRQRTDGDNEGIRNFQSAGLSPLHVAAIVGDPDILAVLLRHDIQITAVDGNGRTAMHYAAESNVECVEILFDNCSVPLCNMPDNNGATPLHWAAYKGRPDCAKALLFHGADVNMQNVHGETALFWAVKKSKVDVVKVLLDFNADPYIENNKGELTLHQILEIFALEFDFDEDLEILQLLTSALGCTPRHLRSQKSTVARGDHYRMPAVDLASIYRVMTAAQAEAGSSSSRRDTVLTALKRSPLSLKQVCRGVVRQALGKVYLPHAVKTLPLPNKLKQFLLLDEIPDADIPDVG